MEPSTRSLKASLPRPPRFVPSMTEWRVAGNTGIPNVWCDLRPEMEADAVRLLLTCVHFAALSRCRRQLWDGDNDFDGRIRAEAS